MASVFCENSEMSGKITLTLEVDANEAEILITALGEAAKHGEKDIAQILDRLRCEIEEQVG